MKRKHILRILSTLSLAWLVFFIFCTVCAAQIYKYKNKDGVWVFTDNPRELPDQGVNILGSGNPDPTSPGPGTDIDVYLNDKLKPANAIEKAVMGVVTVKTPIGTGTGFFVSKNGYIITNKHVLRVTESEEERRETTRSMTEDQIKKIKNDLGLEEEKLNLFKKKLDEYEQYVASLSDGRQKSYARENYTIELKRYQSWHDDFKKRKKQFRYQLSQYRDQERESRYKETLSSIKTSFEISLADNSERTAQLVKVSDNYDLALLKLNDHKTPYLAPAYTGQVRQGQKVFAIGNPANLKNSVSEGIMSGREGIFVKTDAKIYPGNSGGPLVTEEGKVIGINTFKQLTHKFEGLGFAISMDIALQEFGSYISR